jgi:glycyl-tRNA synthetase beta chain
MMAMARRSLLLELGTEEIPASYLERAFEAMPRLARTLFQGSRIEHGDIQAWGTPRRIALLVPELSERQGELAEVVSGPPARAAFDAAGKPTKAAIGFAQKMGVAVEALVVTDLPGKGAYLTSERKEKGQPTIELLPRLLADFVRQIPWKKSMRWQSLDEAFVRPVHWLVALYGGEVVPLSLYGVNSGRQSRGHRFMAPGPIDLTGEASDYREKLRAASVIVDPVERLRCVEQELQRAEQESKLESGVKVRPDPALVAEVANLVEFPHAVVGTFDPAFLEVPAPVVVSAMRAHQRYFATENADGSLSNHFVTIAGTRTPDDEVVRHGNQRVLRARLSDARFFFAEDRRRSLADLVPRLGAVVFQAKLGNMGQKVERVRRLGAAFAGRLQVDAAQLDRAALLCKADLLTKMVGEFPDLQGVMGERYARLAGEPAEVAEAILEHYLPRGAADRLPAQPLGAALGLLDRVDTVVGAFGAKLQPTGSADAFGVRRAALAILHLLLARKWDVPLTTLIDQAVAGYEGKLTFTAETRTQLLDFLAVRLKGLLVEGTGLPADCVDAALATGRDDVVDAAARAQAVAQLRSRPDFEPLGVAFKRVANILKGETKTAQPVAESFKETSERELWSLFQQVQAQVDAEIRRRGYAAALKGIARLKPAIDRFFEQVLVMDPDPALRANRLALLGTINATFARIADFRQLDLQV